MGLRGPKPGTQKSGRVRFHVLVGKAHKEAVLSAVDKKDDALNTAGKVIENCVEQCLPVEKEKR